MTPSAFARPRSSTGAGSFPRAEFAATSRAAPGGLDDLITIVPVTRPEIPYDR